MCNEGKNKNTVLGKQSSTMRHCEYCDRYYMHSKGIWLVLKIKLRLP